MTLEEAVQEYVRAAKVHGDGLDQKNGAWINQGWTDLVKAFVALQGFGAPGREGILKLCAHENRGVRLAAGLHSLKVDEPKASSTLKALSEGEGILAFTAKALLVQWKGGLLKAEGESS